MKKLLCALLCVVLVFSVSACAKIEITPAPEVLAVRDDTISYPEDDLEYDNVKSARFLFSVRRKTVMKRSHEHIRDTESVIHHNLYFDWNDSEYGIPYFFRGQVILRRNYGRYYAVARMTDGSYFFLLFTNGVSVLADYCYVERLTPIEEVETIKIGDTLQQVKRKVSDLYPVFSYSSQDGEETWRIRASDLTTWTLVFEDGRLVKKSAWAPEDSVLTYLLPQDLALIS